MDHWPRRRCQFRACGFLASLAFVTLLHLHQPDLVESPSPEQQQEDYSRPSRGHGGGRELLSTSNAKCQTKSNSDLLIVSTLDGEISALDLSQGGKVAWSLDPEEGPLLSSSISQLEIQGPEGKFKVVPSLDGGLFKWNEEEVEPVPFSADTLLSSSFKLYDDLVMVGGKESITYGINAQTGKTRYVCSSAGCNTFLGDDSDDIIEEEDIVVIQRNQQTVRAVEQRTGSEKWNFSVGQHEISYLLGESKHCKDTDSMEEEEEDYDGTTCWTEDEEENKTESPIMKVFMSPGAVVALSRDGAHNILWKQEFQCAIANAWIIKGGIVEVMDIFASSLPALTSAQPSGSPILPEPMMYLDMYDNQLYVQTSKVVKDALDYTDMLQRSSTEDENSAVALPRVKWRPYYSTPSRTPIMIAYDKQDEEEGSGAMAMWNQYPFDTGYNYYPRYLYPDQTPKEWEQVMKNAKGKTLLTTDGNKSGAEELIYLDLLTISIWNWWKEILSISMVIAISMQLFWHFVKKSTKPERGESVSSETNTGDVDEVAGIAEEKAAEIQQVERPQPSFKSRYLTDFDHQECLGKGGFGIVFQAKNKVDENSYAIKRITLPNREDAREKVLREARALARLDHSGIVRYFNSWLEEPPTGWQEQHDKLLDDGDGMSDTIASTATSATPCTFNKDSHLVRNTQQFEKRTSSNSLLSGSFIAPIPEENGNQPCGSIMDNMIYPNNWEMLENSTGFPNSPWDKEESGSFSIEFQAVDDSKDTEEDSSHSDLNSTAVFDLTLGDCLEASTPRAMASISTSGSGHSQSIGVPFQQYSPVIEGALHDDTDSVQIVFEDSGCADKEDQSMDQSLSSSPTQSTSNRIKELSNKQSGHDKLQPVQTGADQEDKGQRTIEKLHLATPKVYLYIQMQLCQKETLKDWLGNNTLSRDRMKLLHIFDQILGAVHYVHECGMIHRDLKPSNIFFSLNGTIKVGDFGLVTAIDTETEVDSDTSSEGSIRSPMDRRHTSQVGTQLYMSPEQLSGRSYDYKVDIFSLGLIFFELLHPFSTQMERIKIMTTARQQSFPGRFTKELPTESEFAKWLLSISPEKRPDANQLMESELFNDMYKDYTPPRPATGRQRYASNSST